MSLVSIVDSLIGGLIPEANSSASNAQDVTAAADAKLQDDVTKALAGEAAGESSSADEFVSSSDSAKSQAAEIDANIQTNETETEQVKTSIVETDTNIEAASSAITSAEGELTNAEAILASAQAAAAQNTAAEDNKGADGKAPAKKDNGPSVAEAQSAVKAAEQSLSQAEQEKEELETKKEELTTEEASLEDEHSSLEAEGEGVQGEAQNVASGAQGVIGEAGATIDKTNEHVASEEEKAKEEAEKEKAEKENGKSEVTNDDLIDAANKDNKEITDKENKEPADKDSKETADTKDNQAQAPEAASETKAEPKFEVTINGKTADVEVEVLPDGTYNIVSNDGFTSDDNIVIKKDGKEIDINNVSLVNASADDEPADNQNDSPVSVEAPAQPAAEKPVQKSVEAPIEEPKAVEPKVEEPVIEKPVEEPKAEEPKAEEPKAEEPKAGEVQIELGADIEFYQPDAMTRINEAYTTDAEMAEVIVYDMYNGQVAVDVNELVGMSADQAVASLEEAVKTEAFSNTVYKTKISEATDSATVEENQKAISEFVEAYNEAADTVNTPNVEFLSLTDKSNYEAAEALLKRIDQGEYIITKNIESATMSVESIQVSAVDSKDEEEKKYNAQGNDVLSKLQGVVTNDEEAEDNLEDDILTKNEYKEIENFFVSSDDKEVAYDKLAKEAKKYGIFASQIAA